MKQSQDLIKINSDKLRSLITAKMTVADAGRTIGYSQKALQNVIDRGSISVPMKLLVENVLGIPFSEYEYHELEQKAEVKQEIDANQIAYKMMFSAAYAACAEFCNKHMEPLVNAAVARALRDKKVTDNNMQW